MQKKLSFIIVAALLASCTTKKNGYRITERPEILDHESVVKLRSYKRAEQISAFLAAHNAGEISGLCQKRLTPRGAVSDWCIVTEKGMATVIIDYTKDSLIGGYSLSTLKYKGKNRFYNMDTHQYISLSPFLTED